MDKKYAWPSFSAGESKIVSDVLRSNKVNYLFGDNGAKFEKGFSDFSQTKYALAVANGTLALDLCLRSLHLKKGDEVLVTSRSYVASASSIALLGAVPVWCDVDLNSQNIDISEIEKNYSKKTRAILCVHFAGFPCDMDKITSFAKSKNIFVIEDCAQAHGARLNGRSVGSFGHISAWSFCNDKIMSLGGEGGMVTTNSKHFHQFISSFNNHGKNLKKYYSSKKHKNFPYIHDSLGSNYRLTEMQSALGIYQLSKMKSWHALRKRNAQVFIDSVADLKIAITPTISSSIQHAWYKLYITLDPKLFKKSISREFVIENLNQHLVPCSFGGSGEIYREKAFKNISYLKSGTLKNASFLEKNSIILQVHPTISINEIKRRAKILKLVLIRAQK
ncbi:DegT/DnrJ/EryC1/StrS aminotransferase family protein [Gammaproteobacteria bacterium]|nr:DegT/DnrJ/EryC1/StrS aminotransferase family protein [Gammaproteobacteria bacterium]